MSTPPKAGSAKQQYAALPYRAAPAAGVEIMLITSRGTGRWVIPKGWPMKGRTPAQAAEQEAMEEAGIRGTIGHAPIGIYHYGKPSQNAASRVFEVQVFPLEVAKEKNAWLERHQRVRRWFSAAEAAEAVVEPELKALIRRFAAEQMVAPEPGAY